MSGQNQATALAVPTLQRIPALTWSGFSAMLDVRAGEDIAGAIAGM
jgi:hypothetical protein